MEITLQISDYLKALVGEEFHEQLAFSKYFIGDWVLGILISLNFAAFRTIGFQFACILNPVKNVIRYAASFTLTLYLFHQPLLQFYAALISGEEGTSWFFWQTIIATLSTIFVIGLLTEHKRDGIRQWLRKRLSKLGKTAFIKRILT